MVNAVSFGNPLRKLYNCLKNQKKPKSHYELLEKTKNLPVKKFPAGSWTLPVGAKTFTRVQIGKKSDESYLREVVTFYDDKNKIIKRCFKGTGIRKLESMNMILPYHQKIRILVVLMVLILEE